MIHTHIRKVTKEGGWCQTVLNLIYEKCSYIIHYLVTVYAGFLLVSELEKLKDNTNIAPKTYLYTETIDKVLGIAHVQ